jgi:hypothetical protein
MVQELRFVLIQPIVREISRHRSALVMPWNFSVTILGSHTPRLSFEIVPKSCVFVELS